MRKEFYENLIQLIIIVILNKGKPLLQIAYNVNE